MRHSLIALNDNDKDIASFSNFLTRDTNRNDIEKMKQILSQAMTCELTNRQRECVQMYYIENIKMKDIASILSLAPSTVTRHIKAAKLKLRTIAKYY